MIFLIFILTILVYRDSFFSSFFQDDKILLELTRQGNWLSPIANFPYRPVSIQMFYFLGEKISGNQPWGFHLLTFLFFVGTVILIFQLAKLFLKDSTKAMITTFFYALNVSLFANFYWIATSYFSVGAFFYFLCLWGYFQKKWSFLITTLAFFLAVGSNELALLLPLLLLLSGWYLNKQKKFLSVLFLSSGLVFLWRWFLVGLPTASDYVLVFNLQFFATLKWYVFRALNLPEGVRINASPGIIILWGTITTMLAYFIAKTFHWRLVIFSGLWFIVGALPFYFLPFNLIVYLL